MRLNDNNSTIKRQSYLGALTHILGEGADCLYVSKEDVLGKEEELFPLMFIGRPSLKDYIFPEQFYKHNNSVRVFNDYATDFAYFTRNALVRCKYTQPISSNVIATLKFLFFNILGESGGVFPGLLLFFVSLVTIFFIFCAAQISHV